MNKSNPALVLSVAIITALITYAITMDHVDRSLKGVPKIVRDTVYIDIFRKNKWYQHEYQIEAFHDVDDETDSLSVYSGDRLIGTIPVGDHGVDSVITMDNL